MRFALRKLGPPNHDVPQLLPRTGERGFVIDSRGENR